MAFLCFMRSVHFITALLGKEKIVQNGQTERKKGDVSPFLRLPEAVRGYSERRSLFVAQSILN